MRIEELMRDLANEVTIIHNLQQVVRISDISAFMTMGDGRPGRLVGVGPTHDLFATLTGPRTADYVSGRFS